MNILLITPIYATTTEGAGATPVVHYFTREWVKMGHKVTVFHLFHRFPFFFYWFAKLFQHQLNTKLGMLVPVSCPRDTDYVVEGVTVHRRGLRKNKPHARFSQKQLKYALRLIENECAINGIPDCFVGHWDNPQLELLCALKERFHRPVCLVLHSNRFSFEELYGDGARELLSRIDIIGFRNKTAQAEYASKYGKPRSSFIAFSGVSQPFLNEGENLVRSFTGPVHNFIFVGSLIARKHPKAILMALDKVYPEGEYKLTYIGDGAEADTIRGLVSEMHVKGEVEFTGRLVREQIIDYLKAADVFVMVSEGEIFGLVYLEAMALGVIPVGSKNEGIDGIIVNGVNGFLCKAGDPAELSSVLQQLKDMPEAERERMSVAAKETANDYSDKGVAEKYINALRCC